MGQGVAEGLGGPGAVEEIRAGKQRKSGGGGKMDWFFQKSVETAVPVDGFDGFAGFGGEGLLGEVAVPGTWTMAEACGVGTGFGNE